ncbi:MAG: ATP-binding protein, partial [Gammaproteobacteria bacterium]
QVEAAARAALLEQMEEAIDLVVANNLEVAAILLAQHRFTAILLRVTTEDDIDSLQQLTVRSPTPFILLLDSFEDDIGLKGLRQGAQDYLSINQLNEQLVHAIKRAVICEQRTTQRLHSTPNCRACEAPMGKIIATNADGMVVVDRHGLVQFANPAAEVLFGHSQDVLIGQPFGFPVVAGKSTELDVRQKGGAHLVVEMRVAEIPWEGRKAYLATLRDITLRKRMEDALHNLVQGTAHHTGRDFFRLLVRHLAQALDVRYAFVGEIAGAQRDTIRTTAFWAGTDYMDNVTYKFAGTPCEKVVGKELRYFARDLQRLFPQDHRLVEWGAQSYIGTPLYDTSHRPLGVLGVLHDNPLEAKQLAESIVSIFAARTSAELERQHTEEQARKHQAELAHVSRISTMGEMATGVAHELNQPLTSINTLADVAKRTLNDDNPAMQEVHGMLDDIGGQALRACEIIRRLREFVTKRPPEARDVDINVLVNDVVGFMENDLRKRKIKLSLQRDENLPIVSADGIQIEQVILNLVRNAVEAMHEAESQDRDLTIHTGSNSDGDVLVVISDTGPGMDKETLASIFEPFVTTKLEGMGIGLSLSRSIIERHDGRLWAESTPGQGTIFSFSLPVIGS